MIKIFDENLNLIIEGHWIDVLKTNFKKSVEYGEKNAIYYYGFCQYLLDNNIVISEKSIIDVLSTDYDKKYTIKFIGEKSNSELEFWNEYYKYLLIKCNNIFDLINVSNEHEIELKVDSENSNDFELLHNLTENSINIGYKEYTYFFIKE